MSASDLYPYVMLCPCVDAILLHEHHRPRVTPLPDYLLVRHSVDLRTDWEQKCRDSTGLLPLPFEDAVSLHDEAIWQFEELKERLKHLAAFEVPCPTPARALRTTDFSDPSEGVDNDWALLGSALDGISGGGVEASSSDVIRSPSWTPKRSESFCFVTGVSAVEAQSRHSPQGRGAIFLPTSATPGSAAGTTPTTNTTSALEMLRDELLGGVTRQV